MYSKRDIIMDDIKLKDEDIAQLFVRMPEAKREAIIIAQERMIKELKTQVDLLAKDKLDIKKAKAS